MKRLLCILSSLDAGGAETFIMKIFRKLPRDYKIDFIVSADNGFYENEVVALGGKIYRVPLRTKHPFLTFYKIYRVIKNNSYTSVLKLTDTPIALYDLMAAKIGGARLLCVRSCNAINNESILKKFIFTILRPLLNLIADVKIAPSDLAAEYTFGKDAVAKGEVHFLNNGLDLDVYRFSQSGRDRVRKEFNIEGKFVVGHIGRFSHQKNHNFLIDVFAEIRKKNSDAVLLLVGDGELKAKIQNKVNLLGLDDSVIFAGIRKDVPALLSAMDVFVFPSFYEGMPNTVIEAQATGLPCVISSSITNEVQLTKNVQFVSLSNKHEYWATLVNRNNYYDSRDRSKILSDLIKNGYSIDNIVDKFINIVFK